MLLLTGVESLASPDQRFFAYYNPSDLDTITPCLAQLDEYVMAEGPFDGVMGFSAGAVLAAMYLVEKQKQHQGAGDGNDGCGRFPFRCAIFLSSASNREEMGHVVGGAIDDDLPLPPRLLLRIPTAHIWGAADRTAPTGGEDLARFCDPALRLTLVHDGGHELPRREYLTKAVHVIRRTIYLAQKSQ